MNTDVILDFIVEYYLWFIIGGGILILAIIGFIADKKKLFKKKSNKKTNNVQESTLKDSTYEVANVENSDDNSSILENTLDELIPEVNIDNEVSMVNNSSDITQDDVSNQISHFNECINENEIINDENSENNNHIMAENTYMKNSNDIITEDEQLNQVTEEDDNVVDDKISDSSYGQNSDANIDEPIIIPDSDIRDEIKYIDNLELNNQKEVDEYQTITKDDNNIGDMAFTDDKVDGVEVINLKEEINGKENNEIMTTEQLVDLNDKEDEPLNISYSKLKEMVEEIISEQSSERENEINDVQNVSTSNVPSLNIPNDIKPSIEPNLDQNAVEKIKQLDDDEDDVWKF